MDGENSASELVLLSPDAVPELSRFLEQAPDAVLADVAITCARRWKAEGGNAEGRRPPVAFVVSSTASLRTRLSTLRARIESGAARIRDKTGSYYSAVRELGPGTEGKLAFIFPGATSFYPDMLHELAIRFPVCREAFDELEEALAGGAFTPSDFVFPPAPCYRHDADVFAAGGYAQAMVSTYSANAAVRRLFAELGLRPDGVTGFAGGDLSALAAGGYFGEFDTPKGRPDRLNFLREMYKLVDMTAGHAGLPKCVLLTTLSPRPEETAEILATFPQEKVSVAFRQSPKQMLVALAPEIADDVQHALAGIGVRGVRLPVDRPFNTPWCAPVLPFFRKFAARWVRAKPSMPVYSCGSAEPLPEKPRKARELAAAQWAEAVRFEETVRRMHADGFRVFVEAGPRGLATSAVGEVLRGEPHVALAADAVHRAGWPQLLHTVGALAALGAPIDPEALFAGRRCRALDLDSPLTLEIRTDSEMRLHRGLPRLVLAAEPPTAAAALGAASPAAGGKRARERAAAAAAKERLQRQFDQGAAAPLIADADTVDQSPGVTLEISKVFSFSRAPLFAHASIGSSQIAYSDASLRGFTPLSLAAAAEIMAEVAQELVPNRRVIALDDLRFRRPLAFTDGRLKLFARAERSASSDPSVAVVKVLLRDERQDSAWTWPAMEATVLLAAERPLPEPVDIAPLRNPSNVNWTGLDIYPDRLYAGEMNRCITRAALWDRVGLDYEVEMPSSAHAVKHTALPLWLVNPLLLAAVGDGFPLWRSRSPFGGASFALPCRLRRLALYRAAITEGTRLNCYLRLTGVTPKTHVADIVVSSGDGNVVAELRGYEELVERVPVEYGQLLLSPVSAYLTRPVAADLLGSPATSIASAMLVDVPYPIFERNEALWLKTVSQIVLHGAERRPFAEMPGAINRRTEWLFGRIAAKEAVRRFLYDNYQARWTDADIYIWADGSGKPHALGAWQDRLAVRLDLAIAHTSQFVVAVVAANARVGVDVEMRSRALSEEFTRGVFGPDELELAANAVDAPAALVRFWCAKEAVSKALGTGIRYPPKELVVDGFMPDTGEMTVSLHGQWLEAFQMLRGRSVRVSSAVIRGHILASCFLPEQLFAFETSDH